VTNKQDAIVRPKATFSGTLIYFLWLEQPEVAENPADSPVNFGVNVKSGVINPKK
jgi:hypothetical protein